jgi:hypothetical protein
VRHVIEQWAPEYGSPLEADGLDTSKAEITLDIEVPADAWAPRQATVGPAACVLFSDGVRRIDARVWLLDEVDATAEPQAAILASYAAGVVRSRGERAELVDLIVERGLFTPSPAAVDIESRHGVWFVHRAHDATPDALSLALQTRMGGTEADVIARVTEADGADLVVVDGPLRGGVTYPHCAVGYVKTHATSYLVPPQAGVVAQLAPGQRTPLFTITSPLRTRHAWYLRLPGASGHPWAGVVRCEVEAGGRPVAAAVALADLATATIPRFASQGHKDPRAPQNLVPIGGLEHRLRHLLGDRDLLFRGLVRGAA